MPNTNSTSPGPADIGIDLGTTFSVLSVKGRIPTRGNQFPAKYLEACDVSILPTPYGDHTFPSVFWCNASGGDARFGAGAKQLASEGEAPIMFSKRSIGTTEKLAVNGCQFTAREIATKFLTYLKSCAEEVLGRPVRRAVVTHPAYFNENQVQETLQAAADAGFEMASRKQMLMEPTAAALAYTLQDARDPLRVMTYDLGGGTFDVTILERLHGVITIKGFAGDHLLGGYNFDRELVQWVIGRLRSSGRKVPFDTHSPTDQGRLARLLVLAETVKIRLSNQPNARQPVPIRDPDCLIDSQGHPLQILLEINRTDYASLIQEHLARTIDCCRSALATSGLEPSQLHEILLVGGSTYGPWVADCVQNAFGLTPKLYEPDLCVAAGAALAAADLPDIVEHGGITLKLDVPRTVVLPKVSIAGTLQSGTKGDWSAFRVALFTGATPRGTARVQPDGGFLIPNVELQPMGATALTLRIQRGDGTTVLEHPFSVAYAPSEPVRSIDTVLPKSVGVKVAGGIKLVAEEGANLPTPDYTVDLRRLHSDSMLEIPVYQADGEVGVIRIDNIPAEVGTGSAIQLVIRVNEQNELTGKASVLTRSKAVAASCDVNIKFPPIEIPSLAQLKSWLDELEGRRQQQLALSDDAEFRTLLGGAGKKLVQRARRLTGELQPDRHELYQTCGELDRLVNPPIEEMDPPRSQFAHFVNACREFVQGSQDVQMQAYETQLQKCKADGDRAYQEKNPRTWTEANRTIAQLHERLKAASRNDRSDAPQTAEPDPAWVLKDMGRTIVDRLETDLAQQRKALANRSDFEPRLKLRCDGLADQIEEMRTAIEAVSDDEDPRRARSALSRVLGREKTLRRSIQLVEIDTEAVGGI